MSRSSWLREGRMGAFDEVVEQDATPAWTSEERPPDPMASRVRRLLEVLKPAHARCIEDFYFLGKTLTQMAEDRNVSKQAVSRQLERACTNFRKAFRLLTLELVGDDVPEGQEYDVARLVDKVRVHKRNPDGSYTTEERELNEKERALAIRTLKDEWKAEHAAEERLRRSANSESQ